MNLFMVELPVRDLNASLSWYRDRLGLTVERIDPQRPFALLRSSHGSRLALKQSEAAETTDSPSEPASRVLPPIRIHFEVDHLEDTLTQLQLANSSLKSSPEGYRRALLTDPDGYCIILFEWLSSPSESPHLEAAQDSMPVFLPPGLPNRLNHPKAVADGVSLADGDVPNRND
jgi:catechol 2,3-dioxygenase-like lactoylglutathione lyase family enzyme